MISSWISVDDALPDDDVTVLIHCPSSSEPVWIGYLDAVDGSVKGIGRGSYREAGDTLTVRDSLATFTPLN